MFRRRGRLITVSVAGRLLRPLVLLALVALLVPVAPAAIATAANPSGLATRPDSEGAPTAEPAQEQPSQMYLDAKAHENDAVDLAPGERATVPFTPRAGDAWPVDGRAPQALPAGRLSGSDMRTGKSGDHVFGDYAGAGVTAGAAGAARDRAGAYVPLLGAGAPVQPNALNGSLKRDVIGFLPWWKLSASTVLDYNALSTVAYFGVISDSSGNIVKYKSSTLLEDGWSGWTSSYMTNVINAAHAKGTRVALTVELMAWTASDATKQAAVLGSATARQNLAHQVAVAVRDRGADGVNVDAEPIVNGQGANFTAFVRALRSELNNFGSGYEITIDTTGYVGNYELANLVAAGAGDAIFLMGYDFRGDTSNPVGSIAPLVSSKVYDLNDAVSAFLAKIPASKLILGLPWYGRAWSTGSSSSLNATNMSGSTYGYSVTATYATAKELAADHGRRYDSAENSPWTAYQGTYGTSPTWRELYYDDAQSLGAKYDYVNTKGLRGSGIWCLGNDGYMDGSTVVRYPDLWQPIYDKFVNDTTAPEAGILPLSATQGQEAFTVRWTASDDMSGVASYDTQVSTDGGSWTNWLTATKATSATFVGSGGHGYAFRVRATDGSNNVGSWNVSTVYTSSPSLASGGFGLVQADLLNLRKGPGLSYDVDAQFVAGDVVSIVGGPQTADGYIWYQVQGPIAEWAPVGDGIHAGWLATSGSSAWVTAVLAPNATYVNTKVTAFGVAGTTSTSAGPRTISPIVGAPPTQPVFSWKLLQAADSVSLEVYRKDGTHAGTIALGAETTGTHSYAWDGTLSGSPLASGTYLVQLRILIGSDAYYSPSAAPFDSTVWSTYAVQLSSTDRWSGDDRYGTAAAISSNVNAAGVPVVFVAVGSNFPDALAGAAVAGRAGGPVLLVNSTSIPAPTSAELTRLKPARIVILGSSDVVSDSVATALRSYTSGTVARWAGIDRYATAAAVSANTFLAGVPVAFVANGENFPDALAGAAAAAKLGGPILLTMPGSLPAATAKELARLQPGRIVVLGGSAVVSSSVVTALGAYTKGGVQRWSGADRCATSAVVSSQAFAAGVPVVFLANALNFPDGITGAAAAGKLGGPVLLVDPTVGLSAAVRTELARLKPARIVVLGGSDVLPDSILQAAAQYAVGV